MIAFLLVISVAFFLWSAFSHIEVKHSEEQDKKSIRCPPHKWQYETDRNGDEIMICDVCRHRPGYSPRE